MTQLPFSNNVATEHNYPFITAILFWCGLVIVSSVYMMIPLSGVFQKDFTATTSQVAWTSSIFSLFYAVSCLFTGPLSDRYGRKKVIVFGMAILTIITGILGFSNSLLMLIILRALQGLAAATFAPVAVTYISEVFPLEKRVTTVGFISSGFLLAGVVGQIFSSFFSKVYGWHSVFFLIGAIYLGTTMIVALFLPKVATQNHSSNLLASFKQFGSVLRIRPLLLCYFIAITLFISFVGMYNTIGSYLSEEFGLGSSDIFSVRTVGIIGMAFSLLTGILVKRFSLLPILRTGLILAFVGLMVLGIHSNVLILTIMSVLFVTGIAITVPAVISLVGQLGNRARGAAVSLFTFFLFIGASLGPIASQALLRSSSYRWTFESLSLLLVTSLVVSFFIKPSTH